MNKMSDEFTESTIPFDKSEISYSFHKETKKLMRLPFYKLEVLKKQEEKKMKHPHKIKKKEEHPNIKYHEKVEKNQKKKKTVLKKIKEESVKDKESKTNDSVTVDNIKPNLVQTQNFENVNVMSMNKTNDISKNTFVHSKYYSSAQDNPGDVLKKLKYSDTDVTSKKNRLSRKQRRLQEAENTLGSFLNKEDKYNIYSKDNHDENPNFMSYTNLTKQNSSSANNFRNSTISQSQINEKSTNNITNSNNMSNIFTISNSLIKKPDGNLNLIGKKKKRISKFKKAIYKNRFQKKQFIFNNIFNLENCKDTIVKDPEKSIKTHILPQKIGKEDNTEKMILEKNEVKEITKNLKEDLLYINIDKFNNLKNTDNINNPPIINNINVNAAYNYYSNNNNNTYYNNSIQYFQPNPSYFYNNYNPYNLYYNPYQMPANYNFCNNYIYPYSNPINSINNNNNNKFIYEQNFAKNKFDSTNKFKNQTLYNNKVNKNQNKKQNIDFYQNLRPSNENKKGFIFESAIDKDKIENKEEDSEKFKNYLKSSYNISEDITKLEGIDLNNYLKEHNDLQKINIKNLQKITDGELLKDYVDKYEGIQIGTNVNKKIIREYVDQILDSDLDKKFEDFIVKMRDIYFKKKLANPLKAKKRFVVGLREIEKFIRLDEAKCIFIVPNIEKIVGENSLDDRLLKILQNCISKNIPTFFGMNKFKLGKAARKKHSSVSIIAFINIEGFEREFKDLIEFSEKFKKLFYQKFYAEKEKFVTNKFINLNLFEIYNPNMQL